MTAIGGSLRPSLAFTSLDSFKGKCNMSKSSLCTHETKNYILAFIGRLLTRFMAAIDQLYTAISYFFYGMIKVNFLWNKRLSLLDQTFSLICDWHLLECGSSYKWPLHTDSTAEYVPFILHKAVSRHEAYFCAVSKARKNEPYQRQSLSLGASWSFLLPTVFLRPYTDYCASFLFFLKKILFDLCSVRQTHWQFRNVGQWTEHPMGRGQQLIPVLYVHGIKSQASGQRLEEQ